jgi:peptidyl-prolyl cis-trans isomerase A (cyclophilin A)
MRNFMTVIAVGVTLLLAPACGAETSPSPETTPSPSKTQENPLVVLTTSMGPIEIELFPNEAPVSVENFLAYVDAGFYDGTVFHRVIPDFMIQGGGMGPDLQRRETKAEIVNEADNGLKNEPGTLAMARTSDKDSATSQFFINLKPNTFLDHGSRDFGYAVFAKIVNGMEVVEKIAAVPTGKQAGQANVPKEPVTIESAKRK